MKTLSRVVAVLLITWLCPALAAAGNIVEVRPDSPIIQLPDKSAASVLADPERKLEFADIREQGDRFEPAASIGPPGASNRYWVRQRILSQLPTDREIRLMPGGGRGWRNVELTVVDDAGRVIAHAGPSGTLQGAHNHIADLNPYLPLADSPRSTLPIFTLRSGQAVTVYMRGEVDVRFPPKAYAASVVDQLRYLEMRRLGLYTEGALAGAMLASLSQAVYLLNAPISQAARLAGALQAKAEQDPSILAGGAGSPAAVEEAPAAEAAPDEEPAAEAAETTDA